MFEPCAFRERCTRNSTLTRTARRARVAKTKSVSLSMRLARRSAPPPQLAFSLPALYSERGVLASQKGEAACVRTCHIHSSLVPLNRSLQHRTVRPCWPRGGRCGTAWPTGNGRNAASGPGTTCTTALNAAFCGSRQATPSADVARWTGWGSAMSLMRQHAFARTAFTIRLRCRGPRLSRRRRDDTRRPRTPDGPKCVSTPASRRSVCRGTGGCTLRLRRRTRERVRRADDWT